MLTTSLQINKKEKALLDTLRNKWQLFKQSVAEADAMLKAKKVDMQRDLEDNVAGLNQTVLDTRTEFKDKAPFAAQGLLAFP